MTTEAQPSNTSDVLLPPLPLSEWQPTYDTLHMWTQIVGKVTRKQVEEIAKQKMPDLNAASIEAAIKSVKGTARSMGIDVVA